MKFTKKYICASGDVDIFEAITKNDIKRFITFPDRLYKGNKSYVPSLLSSEMDDLSKDKNPAFEYCDARYFMAFRQKKAVGRVAAILNRRFNEVWHRKCVRFSRYDVIDDPEVSGALLKTVEDWAVELGLSEVQGPMGFCDLDQQGLLIDGFDERGLFITRYNYPYYKTHLEALGYVKKVDWIEREIKIPEALDPRIKDISDYAMKRYGLKKLELKRVKDILPYADEVFDLLYEAYSDIYGVIPLTKKQIDLYIGQFIEMVKLDFITVILDSTGHIVSFAVVMPSLAEACRKAKGRMFPLGWYHMLRCLNSKKHEYLEFMLIGVKKEYWGHAVNASIMLHMFEGAKKYGIKFAETGPMLETNTRIQAMWKNFEWRQHKRRRCYMKLLRENESGENAVEDESAGN